jgi:hypothetical protein
MKVANHTRLDTDTVRAMVQILTKGIARRIQAVNVGYTKKHEYHGSCQYHFSMILNVAVAKQESGLYPISMNKHRNIHFNFPKYEVNNELEACLVVLAHEIYHAKASIHHWKNTEKRAETYAFKTLEQFKNKYWS